MPIFEYHCGKCDKDFETLVSVKADEAGEVACLYCGGKDVRKKISSFAFSVSKSNSMPCCSYSCQDGFNNGTCGSGMCGGG